MIKTIILFLLYVGITGLYTYMQVLDYKKLPGTEQEKQELYDSITEVCKLLGKTESEVIKIIYKRIDKIIKNNYNIITVI